MPFNRAGALRKVFLIGRRIGYDKDDLRPIAAQALAIQSDEFSFAKLTDSQLSRLLDHLTGQSGAGPTPVKNSATDKQLYLIRQLEKQLGMHTNPDRLAGFIRRQTNRKSHLDELTVWEASRVIEGLKNLLNRPAAEPEASAPQPASTKPIVHPLVPELPVRGSYTIADLVPHLSISKQTILRRIKDGHLQAMKTGAVIRIARPDLVSFLEAARVSPSR